MTLKLDLTIKVFLLNNKTFLSWQTETVILRDEGGM